MAHDFVVRVIRLKSFAQMGSVFGLKDKSRSEAECSWTRLGKQNALLLAP